MPRPALAERFDLQPHPEGGWFRRTWRSPVEFAPAGYGGTRAAATAIYFLLCPGERSRPHVVRSDELWLWHRGALRLTIGDETVILDAERPQALVPGGVWQSAEPAAAEPALVTCVVAPGFDFADFTME